jgi:hypothetical protein
MSAVWYCLVNRFRWYPDLRPQMDYVPQESRTKIAEFVANYQRAREILEAISEINRELLRRRREAL